MDGISSKNVIWHKFFFEKLFVILILFPFSLWKTDRNSQLFFCIPYPIDCSTFMFITLNLIHPNWLQPYIFHDWMAQGDKNGKTGKKRQSLELITKINRIETIYTLFIRGYEFPSSNFPVFDSKRQKILRISSEIIMNANTVRRTAVYV